MGNKDRLRRGKRKHFQGNQHETANKKKRNITLKKQKEYLDTNNINNSIEEQPSCRTLSLSKTTTENGNVDSAVTPALSSSAKKLKRTVLDIDDSLNEDNSFYVLFDSSILKELVQLIGNCPECLANKVKISHCNKRKLGLCQMFLLKCCTCGWEHELFTSQKKPKVKQLKGMLLM